MARLTRAQQQERTRASVLEAARAEFTERGYAAAKVDGIAERAELTRGAVYSNFPSKRALYLAVLATEADSGRTDDQAPASPPSPAEALGAFARTWFDRPRPLAGVLDDEPLRIAYGQLARLESLLLALALESYGKDTRQVRRAALALRLLEGPGASVDPALGLGDPFDIAAACAQLAGLDLADTWDPPHLPHTKPAQSCRDAWTPPEHLPDLITGRAVGFAGDGVLAVLGSSRLEAAEEAVRATRAGDQVTVAVVTAAPDEIGRLVRVRIAGLARCLRRVFAPDALPRLRVVLDDGGLLAAAAGIADADDATEAAVRIGPGRITARAQGRGAAHAAAAAQPARGISRKAAL
ncbi:TetR/AcrR family transcriptional regulator [Streptomyces boninensis]|uniref:TetR/AcrR family transcriptional regulator n=1 Tax=Streptomyces boninensis TaxID=2039455 RepID=UPI003B22468C